MSAFPVDVIDSEALRVIGASATADRAIAEAIRLNRDHANYYFGCGLGYAAKQDYNRAILDFTEAIRLNPKYAGTFINRGNAYYG